MASNYWQQRIQYRQAVYDRASDTVMARINAAYDSATRQIEADIRNILDNYAKLHNMTHAQARTYLNQTISPSILDRLRSQAAHVTDPKARDLLLRELDAPAYRARIKRLEAIQESVRTGMTQAADVELTAVTKHLKDTAKDAYGRTMFDIQKDIGIGFGSTGIPNKQLEQILRNRWSGENYSSRIWQNRDALSDIVHQAVTEAVTMGKTSTQVFDALKNATKGGQMAANRLLRTETAFVTNQVEMEAYKDADIDQYEFMSVLDSRTSEICGDLDGKIFDVKDQQPGVNCPPMHPFCRSVTAPYLSSVDKSKRTRAARDGGGNAIKVPRTMTYAQWKEQFLKDGK